MDKYELLGSIIIQTDDHIVEYDPGSQVGSGVVFLRSNRCIVPRNIAISIKQIDEVISMLKRMKKVVKSLEE